MDDDVKFLIECSKYFDKTASSSGEDKTVQAFSNNAVRLTQIACRLEALINFIKPDKKF